MINSYNCLSYLSLSFLIKCIKYLFQNPVIFAKPSNQRPRSASGNGYVNFTARINHCLLREASGEHERIKFQAQE